MTQKTAEAGTQFKAAVAALATEPDTPTAKDEVTEAKAEVLPKVEAKPEADPLLVQILSTRRSHGSQGDLNFRLWLFNYIKSTLNLTATIEVEGSILVQTDPKSTVLFSCHVDTVHSRAESDGKPQQLAFDPAFGHLFLADKANSGCLGGDDGCGVYIMLKMLKAGVKGKFIFHTGEESGGIGSRAFVSKRKQFCEDLEMVVAFDRAVRTNENPEVILTQGNQKCASVEFGEALCKELNKVDFDLPYTISHKGSFTDSKIYRDLVPECVNIGCFYQHQHSSNEYVDVVGLEKLVKAACAVEWNKLPIIRNPLARTATHDDMFADGFMGDNSGYHGMWQNHKNFGNSSNVKGKGKQDLNGKSTLRLPPKDAPVVPTLSVMEELQSFTLNDFNEYVLLGSEEAASTLMTLVLKVKALEAELDGAKTMLGL